MLRNALVMAIWLAAWHSIGAAETVLPEGAATPPVAIPHFPDRVHAFVWRNWRAVEVEKMARILGTSVENVVDLARSMGLPENGAVSGPMTTRGYITLIRRNWHLLPYEQLLQLVEMTPERLEFLLREDDFLFIKLGNVKPRCEPLRYCAPDKAVRHRAAEIRRLVEVQFGEEIRAAWEPRFQFLKPLREPLKPLPGLTAKEGEPLSLRFIYSYASLYGDPLLQGDLESYSDEWLSRLAALGVNGVWMHVVLRDLAPGGETFPEFGQGWQRRLANLRKVVDRARKFGIGVYLYLNEPRSMPESFFRTRPDVAGVGGRDGTAMCTSHPAVRKWLSDATAHVFREVPGLAGLFTITASENLTNCASHGGWKKCPRCANRTDAEIIAEVNATLAEGAHRSNPKAKVMAWDWGWRGHGNAVEIVSKLPSSVYLMSVSEWAVPIDRGGVKTTIGEYSLSVIGPGPRALRHWEAARQVGVKIVAKTQVNLSWELSTVPYLPVMDQVAEHFHALAQRGVEGALLSWSLGGYPSPNLEVACRFACKPVPSVEEVLDTVAKEHFGASGAPEARRAWTLLSKAFRQYPFNGGVIYSCPVQMGPANLLYPTATGYAASMVGIPYDDLKRWRGPYPPEIFISQFEKVAAGWEEGLQALGKAVELSPPEQRAETRSQWRVARAAWLHFKSVANQARFTHLRNRLVDPKATLSSDDRRRCQAEMKETVAAEIALARELFSHACLDPRLGFEASNHYFYLPSDLAEKVISCHSILDTLGAGN